MTSSWRVYMLVSLTKPYTNIDIYIFFFDTSECRITSLFFVVVPCHVLLRYYRRWRLHPHPLPVIYNPSPPHPSPSTPPYHPARHGNCQQIRVRYEWIYHPFYVSKSILEYGMSEYITLFLLVKFRFFRVWVIISHLRRIFRKFFSIL